MSGRALWRWTEAGVVVDAERDAGRKRLWINPVLPEPPIRARYPLHVAILLWFQTTRELDAALGVIRWRFGSDTVLVAIARLDDATQFVLYTSADPQLARDRYMAVRAVLGPPATGLTVLVDPQWQAMQELRIPSVT